MLVKFQFKCLLTSFILIGFALSPFYTIKVYASKKDDYSYGHEAYTSFGKRESDKWLNINYDFDNLNLNPLAGEQFEKIKGAWFFFQAKENENTFHLATFNFNESDELSIIKETYSKDFEDGQYHKISTSHTELGITLVNIEESKNLKKISFKISDPILLKYTLKWDRDLLEKPLFYKKRVTDFMKKDITVYFEKDVKNLNLNSYTDLLDGLELTLVNSSTLKIINKPTPRFDSIYPGSTGYFYRPGPLEAYFAFANLISFKNEKKLKDFKPRIIHRKKAPFYTFISSNIISLFIGAGIYWIINKYAHYKP